jgi:DNA-directed RNA polymerase specialized sigma24 family protein
MTEETVAELELQRHINRALAQLPRRWREAFILYSVEGLTLEEVARVNRQPVDATRRVIELTRELLRANLAEAGIRPAERELRREVVA